MPLVVTQSSRSSPILIVDREGIIGTPLAKEIAKTHLTMLVSAIEPDAADNIISVPFHKKIPVIPDNTFSHIFVVYNGKKELRKAFPSFLRKAKESDGRFILVTDIFHYRESFFSTLEKQYEKVDVLVVGDLFSPTLEKNSPVNHLLNTAKTYGKLRLSNSGLDPLYPIALDDVVEGIIASVFTSPSKGSQYLLFPPHPVTQLSVARDLQKKYPLLCIDFTTQKKSHLHYNLPSSGTHLFSNYYPLAERLSHIDLSHTKLGGMSTMPNKPSFSPVRFPKLQKAIIPLLIALFVLLLPFIVSIGLAFAGGLFFMRSQDQLGSGGLTKAVASARTSSELFVFADTSAGIVHMAVGAMGVDSGVVGFQDAIHTGRQVSGAYYEGLNAGVLLQRVFRGEEKDPKQSFIQASEKIKSSLIIIQGLQAEKKLPRQIAEKLEIYQKPMALVLNTLDTYPKLLGFEGKKKYLFLFLNNAELRSGGGFIGSFALADIDKARLVNFKIYDVYDADGQLKTPIDPPFEFQRYLGSSNLFMRDSNFSIDFPTGAVEVARMLNLEIGEKVDGVIALDTTFLGELIGINGSLSVPDYKETLTRDNFYTKVQTYAQKDFFPGSTKKKDFLRSVQASLATSLESGNISEQKLLLLISRMTEEKHLLFASPESSIQKLFTINNASSSIVEQRSEGSSKFLDFVGLSEENLGENKANHYLKRSIEQKITINGEGEITERLDVQYRNMSSSKTEFGGNYESYVRLIAPSNTVLKEVLIDNVAQAIAPAITNPRLFTARNFRPPNGIEIEERVESGRKVFGFYIVVPRGAKKKVTLTYVLSKKAPVDLSSFEYDLLVFKQPGTLADPYKLTVSFPIDTKLFRSNQPVNDVGGKLLGETTLVTDKNFVFTFSKR